MAIVLRAFDYSFDGVTALKANVGDDIDFGDMTDGLQTEGYVAAAPPAPPAPDVAPVVAEAVEPVLPEPEAEAPHAEHVAEETPIDEPVIETKPKRNRR